MFKVLLVLLGLLVLAAICAFAYLFFMQRRIQYFPTHNDKSAKGNDWFQPWRSEKGDFLGYQKAVSSPKRVILFFHGNGGEALDRAWLAELIPEDPYVLLLAEYPGYGAMPGDPAESEIFTAAERALQEATTKWKVPVTLVGESLGSGVAAHLASRPGVDRLALISPFTSATDVAALHYPQLPVRWLMRDRYDSVEALKQCQLPLHIIHGTLDDVVPIALGKSLMEKYPGSNKTMTVVPGYGHNNIANAAIDSPFAEKFRSFIRGN